MAAGFAPPPVNLQQFNTNNGTQNNSNSLGITADSQQEILDDNSINTLHEESREIEVHSLSLFLSPFDLPTEIYNSF